MVHQHVVFNFSWIDKKKRAEKIGDENWSEMTNKRLFLSFVSYFVRKGREESLDN